MYFFLLIFADSSNSLNEMYTDFVNEGCKDHFSEDEVSSLNNKFKEYEVERRKLISKMDFRKKLDFYRREIGNFIR